MIMSTFKYNFEKVIESSLDFKFKFNIPSMEKLTSRKMPRKLICSYLSYPNPINLTIKCVLIISLLLFLVLKNQ